MKRSLRALLCASVGGLLLVYLAPTIVLCLSSLGLVDASGVEVPSVAVFLDRLEEPRLQLALRESVPISLAAAASASLIALLAVSLIHQTGVALARTVVALLLLPLFFPETAHALSLLHFFVSLGLSKGLFVVTLGLIVYVLPIGGVIIFLGYQAITRNLAVACHDLGLDLFDRLRIVYLPILWPALVSSVLFCFLVALNEYTRTSYWQAREMYSVFVRGQLTGGGTGAVYQVSAIMVFLGVGCLLMFRRALYRAD